MRNVIFIDNDLQERAEEDVDYVKDILERNNFTHDEINNINIISSFSQQDSDEIMKLIFHEKPIICTFSMYTANNYGSLYQLFRFLSTAGNYNIKDVTYIDCSGMIVKALRQIDTATKRPIDVLMAIEKNIILSPDDNQILQRVRVNLMADDVNNMFYLEQIN